MKSVGKQLQEGRLAKNWTPELAARETKIKVDRLRDLESDDYSHFTSPTYARGFVRTYARALGLDEYRILRQLDNKLPDDDSANIVTDGGVAYLPETAMPPRVAHRDFTGLYIVMGLGCVVAMAIVFVLFEAYRVGELSRWFASTAEPPVTVAATNSAPIAPTAEAPARALPIDSNTPPPIADATTNSATATNAPALTADTNSTNAPGNASPRALPVDPSALASNSDTNATPTTDAQVQPPRALPVDSSELTNATATTPATYPATNSAPAADSAQNAPIVAPRALPVDPSELTNAETTPPAPTPLVAVNTPAPAITPPPTPPPLPSSTARQSNSGPVMEPSLPPVQPSTDSAPIAPVAPTANDTAPQPPASDAAKPLVLTASQDSFVRVTNLDAPDAEKPLYAAVLHSGESVGFDGHKFSINVGIPSAVDIKLDGVNYGPHSDLEQPETFTVQSHLQ